MSGGKKKYLVLEQAKELIKKMSIDQQIIEEKIESYSDNAVALRKLFADAKKKSWIINKRVTDTQIIQTVLNDTHVGIVDIMNGSRKKEVVTARYLCILFMDEMNYKRTHQSMANVLKVYRTVVTNGLKEIKRRKSFMNNKDGKKHDEEFCQHYINIKAALIAKYL